MEVTRRQIGTVLVLSFAEPLCLEGETCVRFKERMRGLLDEKRRQLVVDLGNVEFVDSSGLGALISTLKVLRANDGEMVLTNVTEAVRSVLEITRLLRVFDVYDTPEDALAALAGSEAAAPTSR